MKYKRVMVGNYSYDTNLRVKIGSRVLLPTPDFLRDVRGDTWEGTVSALESSYTGTCKNIIAILPKRKK